MLYKATVTMPYKELKDLLNQIEEYSVIVQRDKRGTSIDYKAN
ncbi:hypothetical protein [Clostridium pasteurianum]|uniref:Uncharacterized protein n=1 Tax=Clostridium pasteurianum BC1 TaxID=86416 RepID=R4K863_CLOPA|nr:hypothetical protein [Clostridium pasteurianum]AGK95830.1 hypothetical protein Clopa_0801 [Clostridium pasteurianum BC1]